MPIYEYRCEQCGHEFDALQKIADAPLIDCPACGVAALKKKLSAPAFRLKGTGWYETDFKQGDKRHVHVADDGSSGGNAANDKPADNSDNKTAVQTVANKPETPAQSESKPKAPAAAPTSSLAPSDS